MTTHPRSVLPSPPLPAGWPRDRYVRHNRQLKATRIAAALLATGPCPPTRASDEVICETARHIGVRPPSTLTRNLVRALLPRARGHLRGCEGRARRTQISPGASGAETIATLLDAAEEDREVMVTGGDGRRARVLPVAC